MTSSQPGGVFGLLPDTKKIRGNGDDPDNGELKKKKKHRPRRKKRILTLKESPVKAENDRTETAHPSA